MQENLYTALSPAARVTVSELQACRMSPWLAQRYLEDEDPSFLRQYSAGNIVGQYFISPRMKDVDEGFRFFLSQQCPPLSSLSCNQLHRIVLGINEFPVLRSLTYKLRMSAVVALQGKVARCPEKFSWEWLFPVFDIKAGPSEFLECIKGLREQWMKNSKRKRIIDWSREVDYEENIVELSLSDRQRKFIDLFHSVQDIELLEFGEGFGLRWGFNFFQSQDGDETLTLKKVRAITKDKSDWKRIIVSDNWPDSVKTYLPRHAQWIELKPENLILKDNRSYSVPIFFLRMQSHSTVEEEFVFLSPIDSCLLMPKWVCWGEQYSLPWEPRGVEQLEKLLEKKGKSDDEMLKLVTVNWDLWKPRLDARREKRAQVAANNRERKNLSRFKEIQEIGVEELKKKKSQGLFDVIRLKLSSYPDAILCLQIVTEVDIVSLFCSLFKLMWTAEVEVRLHQAFSFEIPRRTKNKDERTVSLVNLTQGTPERRIVKYKFKAAESTFELADFIESAGVNMFFAIKSPDIGLVAWVTAGAPRFLKIGEQPLGSLSRILGVYQESTVARNTPYGLDPMEWTVFELKAGSIRGNKKGLFWFMVYGDDWISSHPFAFVDTLPEANINIKTEFGEVQQIGNDLWFYPNGSYQQSVPLMLASMRESHAMKVRKRRGKKRKRDDIS
jgi:hypothetical protein